MLLSHKLIGKPHAASSRGVTGTPTLLPREIVRRTHSLSREVIRKGSRRRCHVGGAWEAMSVRGPGATPPGCHTRALALPVDGRGRKVQKEGKISYADFVWFLLSEEDKRTPTR